MQLAERKHYGPYFFENVNEDTYRIMIIEFFALALHDIDVKDVGTIFDFNRMVQLVIDLMSQSIYCVKRLVAAYLAEMVKSIGHPEAAI